MKTFVFVFALVGLFVVVSAQTPPVHAICEMPSRWSATLSQILLIESLGGVVDNFGEIYVDTTNQQVRVDIANGKSTVGGTTTTYEVTVWQDYKNQIEYVWDHSTNTCTSMPFNIPLLTQLPSNAQYGGALLLGSQPVHEYFWPEHYQGNTYLFETGLMSGTCLPFNVEIFSTKNNGTTTESLVMSESFLNAVPSIPPFLMEVPSECMSSLRHPKPIERRMQSLRHALAPFRTEEEE